MRDLFHKKIFMTLAVLTLFVLPAVSQDTEEKQEVYAEDIIETKIIRNKLDWMLCFTPAYMLQTRNTEKSAPGTVVYPFSAGIIIPADSLISFQPRLSVFSNYYLWSEEDKCAYTAEIENRTATTYNFLVDLPAVLTLNPGKKHFIETGLGAALLFRLSKISNGLLDSDEGSSGSVKDDVSAINRWGYQNANFLYLEASVGYLFMFTEKIKAGPEVRFLIPVGSLVTDNGMNNAFISAGIKCRF